MSSSANTLSISRIRSTSPSASTLRSHASRSMLLLVTVSSSFSVLVDFEEWSSGRPMSGGPQTFVHHSRVRGRRRAPDFDFTVVGTVEPDTILAIVDETLRRLATSEGFQFEMPEKLIERRADSMTVYVS